VAAVISSIFDFIQRLGQLLVWWTVIQPWEQGIRVRLGKGRTRIGPGIHWKIPHVDLIYKQSTRRRYSTFGPATITTRDGATITLAGSVGYSIDDLDKLYDGLHHPEDAIRSLCSGAVTQYIVTHDLAECAPDTVVTQCRDNLDLGRFGLYVEQFMLTTYARVRTYRLIMDNHPDQWGDSISTTRNTEP
jgi:hypothetical protein